MYGTEIICSTKLLIHEYFQRKLFISNLRFIKALYQKYSKSPGVSCIINNEIRYVKNRSKNVRIYVLK